MIGFLEGTAASSNLVTTSSGVGYVVECPTPLVPGGTVSLFVTTVVRETSISLFGFDSEFQQGVFAALTKVSGVGPSAALNIIRDVGAERAVSAIRDGDHDVIRQATGVGPTLAKKIVSSVNLPETLLRHAAAADTAVPGRSQVVDALTRLGFDQSDAFAAVDSVPAAIDDESAVLAAALGHLRGVTR